MSGWTTEVVTTLRAMVGAGKSANDIALVTGFSRSAVIGKATRLGLKLHGQMGGARSPKQKSDPVARAPVAKKSAASHPGNIRSKKDAMKGDPGLEPPITSEDARRYDATARAVPLDDVGKGGCKFPVNAAALHEPHLFCGHPASHGSWCDHHRRRVFGQGTRGERRAEETLRKEAAR